MSNYKIHLEINYELIEVEATPNYNNKNRLLVDSVSMEDIYSNLFIKVNSDNVSFLDTFELENIKVNIENLPFTDICSKEFTKNSTSEAIIWDNVEIIMEEIESLTLNSYQLNSQALN